MFFLDNASTTQCFTESAEIIKQALINDYFNPSAKYRYAMEEQKKLNECRRIILSSVGAINFDCIFTGSATESNNLVINSLVTKHYVSLISGGEHSSIYEPVQKELEDNRKIEFLKLDEFGAVDLKDFEDKMTKDVGFISVMYVSNETGAINDIKQIVEIARSVNPKVLIHVDAVQGYCKLPINLEEWGIDYLTISSHKVNGPKGVGALIVRKKCKLSPQILGGGQENGVRSGTENLPSVLGFANSVKIHMSTIDEDYKKVLEFKTNFYNRLLSLSKDSGVEMELNGKMCGFSPYILSVSFVGIKAEVLLHSLEEKDILVGTGSACNSHHSGNRVLEGMHKSKQEVEGNIRFSFSSESVNYDAQCLAQTIIENAKKIKRK